MHSTHHSVHTYSAIGSWFLFLTISEALQKSRVRKVLQNEDLKTWTFCGLDSKWVDPVNEIFCGILILISSFNKGPFFCKTNHMQFGKVCQFGILLKDGMMYIERTSFYVRMSKNIFKTLKESSKFLSRPFTPKSAGEITATKIGNTVRSHI